MALRASPIQINTPIERLKGASATILKPLKNLGITTYADLLLHVPTRYDDFSHTTRIADAQVGETVTVQGVIRSIENARSWKRHMHITHATISDGSGELEAVWFNQPFLTQTLAQGKTVSLSGK